VKEWVTDLTTEVMPTSQTTGLEQMRNCRLMRCSRGYAIHSGLPGLAELQSEATAMFQTAQKHEWWEIGTGESQIATIDEDRTNSQPRRRAFTTPGGRIQQELYHAPSLLSFLSSETGLALERKADTGSYSYYMQPGDFIGLHRDGPGCDIAALTVLYDSSTQAEKSGGLLIYPDRVDESIYSIRQDPSHGAVLVKMLPGQTLIILGGLIPHQLIPVRRGQLRIVSALCFKLTNGQG
jgi:hypothetical protein